MAHPHRRLARDRRSASSTVRCAAGRRSTATGIAALGADFTDVDGAEQDRRLARARELRRVLYEHACEGAYGPPEYGGNRDLAGWQAIEFPGDAQPRGYTDEEVSRPCLTQRPTATR